ncbi:guanylate kinase [Dichomitus squalens]|uniref:Guanylate kinase n=1 Tax=Dichomitus squalens TaxID=114155 RepID=A0A4Q9P477_9APHY|nr:guanylate kinase [Dichomitus squalens LYAD-421 SS1]EJF64195.1 guanylate kinase [Dichomitus squalens LYAD-421 SS1]TBU30712.1 guanylate kinase [Dichomitus squalens]TBU49210.1 guanylate kinase [Dichomitus squalens]TBU60923.1 guanylate kinase [Dichomitus squalens]
MPPAVDFLRPLVISGPSGVGKSTLLKLLFADHPNKFGFSVSHTTRAPRTGEVDGKDYYFVSKDKFKELIAQGAFIEHAQFSDNFYGTSYMTVHEIEKSGRRCLLDIEAQGVRQIKGTSLNPVYLFVSPPSLTALRTRLKGRATEDEAAVAKRLAAALREIEYAKEGAHDFVIVNDDLPRAYEKFQRVALGEPIESDPLPPLDD